MPPGSILLEQTIYGLVLGSIYALFATGFSFIFGSMGLANFAQGAFYAVAGYFSYIMLTNLNWHPALALIVPVFLVAVIGIVVERVLLSRLYGRRGRDFFFGVVLVTFALYFIAERALGTTWSYWPKMYHIPALSDITIYLGPAKVDLLRILTFAIALLVAWGLSYFVKKTKPGKAIRAIVQDREAAPLMGINVATIFTMCFAIGTALGALAGVLVGPIYSLYPEMGHLVQFKAVVIIIIGGMGNIWGAWIAAMVIGLWENLSINWLPPAYTYAIEFAVIILFFIAKGANLPYRVRAAIGTRS